ncbi:hypothetical protein ACJX0J_016156 [Zea mays]
MPIKVKHAQHIFSFALDSWKSPYWASIIHQGQHSNDQYFEENILFILRLPSQGGRVFQASLCVITMNLEGEMEQGILNAMPFILQIFRTESEIGTVNQKPIFLIASLQIGTTDWKPDCLQRRHKKLFRKEN